MRDGNFRVFKTLSDDELDPVRSILATVGASDVCAHYPTPVELDGDGGYVEFSPAVFARRLQERENTTIAFWLNFPDHIFVDFTFPSRECPVLAIGFTVELLTADIVASMFLRLVEHYVLSDASPSTLGLLLDTQAATQQFNWDYFFLRSVAHESGPLVDDIPWFKTSFRFIGGLNMRYATADYPWPFPEALLLPSDQAELATCVPRPPLTITCNGFTLLFSPVSGVRYHDEVGDLIAHRTA